MSLEKAKKKLSELLPILAEYFHPQMANDLLQPAIRLVDGELVKLQNIEKWRNLGTEEAVILHAEDRKAAIKRMQEEAGEALVAKAAKPVKAEEVEDPVEGVSDMTDYEEFLRWKADKITQDPGTGAPEPEAEKEEKEEKEAKEPEAKEVVSESGAPEPEAEKAPKKAAVKAPKQKE